MICPAGHRIIPSTGEHYTLREVAPGLYVYYVGDCKELEAVPQPIPAASAGEGLPSDTRSDGSGRAGSRAAEPARYGSQAAEQPQRPAAGSLERDGGSL